MSQIFVIPPKPANADELSDEDLEKVAGGIDLFTGIVLLSAVTVVGVSTVAANATTRAQHGW